MLGYVLPDKGELKVREYEIYTGYYCGICKYIGRAYGQLPRMALSYDATFIALILSCVDPAPDEPRQEHCAVHHIRYKTIIRNRAIEYAGDLMLILAWFKLQDDAQDEGKFSAKAGLASMRRIWRKLQAKHPDLCREMGERLAALNQLEQEHCSSIDRVAEDFARIMERIFRDGITFLYGPSSNLHETFANVGYHLGKWIYLIDAVDDIEENLKTGSYNPLLYRFQYRFGDGAADSADAAAGSGTAGADGTDAPGTDPGAATTDPGAAESPEAFRARIDEQIRFNLFHYLAVISESVEALDIRKNSGIIENVIYFGLNRKTEEVLKRIKPEKRRHGQL